LQKYFFVVEIKLTQAQIGKFDELDFKIIEILQENSKLSYNKIAKRLDIAAGTVYNRMKNLEERGILKGYTIIVDPIKVGYNLTALILIQAEGKKLLDAEKELAKNKNVILVYDITGDFDIACVARFKNRIDLNDFVKSILTKPYIKKTVTNIVLNVVKEDLRVKEYNF